MHLIKRLPSFIVVFTFCALTVAFNLSAQKPVKVKSRNSAGTWTVDWSANGIYFAVGGDDSLLQIYSASTFKIFKTMRMQGMIRCLSWHPKENLLAIAISRQAYLLDLSTGKILNLERSDAGGRGLEWNHNGELLALADGHGVVQIWNKGGKHLRSIKKHNNNSYLSIDWHPSKNILVTSSDEIILFDTSGRQLNMIRHREEATGVLTVRWHPSGSFFTSGDYGHDKEGIPTLLQFWKEDGTLIRTIKGSKAEYRNIRWSKDGRYLATASDALRIWDRDGNLLHTGVTGYNLWGLSWNPQDNRILSASFEGFLDLWDLRGRKVVK